MTLSSWHEVGTTTAIFVGILLGCGIIATVCWTWIKDRSFGYGGSVLSLVGLVFVGLSAWQSVDFGVSNSGLTLKVQSLITDAERKAGDARASAERARVAAAAGNTQQAESAAADSAHSAEASALSARCASILYGVEGVPGFGPKYRACIEKLNTLGAHR